MGTWKAAITFPLGMVTRVRRFCTTLEAAKKEYEGRLWSLGNLLEALKSRIPTEADFLGHLHDHRDNYVIHPSTIV